MQENIAQRPTMKSVVTILDNHIATLAVPSKRAFLMHSYFGPDKSLHSNSKRNSIQGSINEASITELYPHYSCRDLYGRLWFMFEATFKCD